MVLIGTNKESNRPGCNIILNGSAFTQYEKFQYLGKIILADKRSTDEIKKNKIRKAKLSFHKLKNILTNRHRSLEARKGCSNAT